MSTMPSRRPRVIARLAAFVLAIPAMLAGAFLALQALYGLTTGTASAGGRGATAQALSALASLALLVCGVRLLVFATNAQAAHEHGAPRPSGDDTAGGPRTPPAGRARFALVEARMGLAVSGIGLGVFLLAIPMRWDVGPIAGILLIVHGGLISLAGKALAREGNWAWLGQVLPIGFLAVWRLTYCAEALLDRCS